VKPKLSTQARIALLLLGLMSLTTFVAAPALFLVLRGGQSPQWPPDRPIEWGWFYAVSGGGAILFLASLIAAWRIPRK
jgi:hypothetical protein